MPVSFAAGSGSGRRSSARLAGTFVNEEIEKKAILNGINQVFDKLESTNYD